MNKCFSLLTLSLLICGVGDASGQNIKGTISGVIQDSDQRALPGVKITIRHLSREFTRNLISNHNGQFHQSGLESGPYQVLAHRPKFRSYESDTLYLEVGQVISLEIQLSLAGIETFLKVSAQVLQLEDNELSRGFSAKEMSALPVQTGGQGRNFYSQAKTAPGVVLSTLAHRPFAVSGQRPRNNNYMIDSVEMNDADSGFIAGRGFTEQLVSQETIQSFEIITHNFKAEYGRNSGAIINIVTKSGNNQFHGSTYWYHNNSALSARAPLETTKSPSLSNISGFTLSGPIRKNSLYFFGNLEFFRPRGTTLVNFRTLTDEQKTTAVPSVRPLAALYPTPPPTSTAFVQGVPRSTNGLTYMLRGDLDITEKQKIAIRTSLTQAVTKATAIGNTVASDVTINNKTRGVALHHTYTLSPNLLNELRFGFMKLLQKDSNFENPILLGNQDINGRIGSMIVPGLSLAGPLSFLGRNQIQRSYQLNNNISLLWGNHIVKLGSSLHWVQVDGGTINNAFLGSLFFPSIESFLSGQPLSYSRTVGDPLIDLRRWEWHSYFQDDWKLTNNFTLNLGVRYELNTVPTEVKEKISQDFMFQKDLNNFSPRLGFAWSPSSGTVIRGGYGIFYNTIEMAFLGLTRFNPPLLETFSVFQPTFPNLSDQSQKNLPSGLVLPDPNITTPYAQHINLKVEQELWHPQTTLSAAYVGTLGRKLTRNRRPNGGENLDQTLRPDVSVGVVNRLENSASSNYHSLQVLFKQQLGRGKNLHIAYTYSRFMDDVSEIPTTNTRLGPGIIPLDEHNLTLDWGPSDFHIPHILTLTGLYKSPFPQSNRWLGGWAFSGIVTLQSGRPYTLYSGTDTPGGSNNNRINNIHGSLSRNPSNYVPLHLTSGFSTEDLVPLPELVGTLGRNTEQGDSFLDWNLSIGKYFVLSEETRVEFRAEIFNIFGITNLNEVDNILISPTFGSYLSALEPRRIQLALRIFF